MRRAVLSLLLALLAAGLLFSAGPAAHANWLTKILKEAGEAGGDVAGTASRIGAGALDEAAAALKRLPKSPTGKTALAAHASPEGHWTFTNSEGVRFTAANSDEMGRVARSLVPDAGEAPSLSLYLSEETLFQRPRFLDDLPKDAELHIVHGRSAFPLVRRGSGEGAELLARVRGRVLVKVGRRADFVEAVWQLGRKLERADIRVLSLKPGGPQTVPPRARFAKSGGVPLSDAVDPSRLADALASLRGQTVLVTGRIEGDLLQFQATGGSLQSVSLTALREAAGAADVNLVVLKSTQAAQPGGQNWLWQTIEVGGLKTAVGQPSYGDFLAALAEQRGAFAVSVKRSGEGRVIVQAVPDAASGDLIDTVGNWWGDTLSDVAGNLVTEGIEASMTSQARQKELDDRIVPGVPSALQFYVIGAVVMGLIAFSMAHAWFARLWPKEDRGEYRGHFGYLAARAVRWLTFVCIFLPIAGPFALLATVAVQIFNIATLPFRALWRLIGPRSV